MIINSSYFTSKPLYIPNSIAQPAIGYNTPDNVSELNMFIDVKEREFLLSFLGYEQMTELLGQFTSEGEWIENPSQKWVDLVDGKEDWKGLRYEIGGHKYSIIAYYVYFYFLGEDATYYSTTGVQSPDAANSTAQTPNSKQVRAWNTFVKEYGNIRGYMNTPTFFTNWNGLGMTWLGNSADVNIITLYEYLSKNSEIYSRNYFSSYSPLNTFGL